ncbi:stage II sporulation protein D [Sporosarcina pasteurii]|uniref:H-34 n=1 Tax=Sporosarcina pasteurii TaxID=1474 RepID=A0A380BCF8_SPOPA|nr:stage II sporulation protein D [Sporosarcina pasteurii]MDS9472265.1 stage II sporulation protein D [Sporosarcina pasteurii]QBQ06246.1 stage II sporulation protein D [Sporosarcina pasteurii]SUI99113.1 H-34 [Sporosarcina pasteurii]
MRKLWIALSIFVLLLFFFPLLIIKESPKPQAEQTKKEGGYCPFEITVQGVDKPFALEEYVKGVVAAEMPIAFHEEALKAQALAARTYALRTTEKGVKPIAKDVSAQVFYTEAERKKNWGKEFKKNEKKIDAAVRATAGEIIVYEDEIISAMFFSTSNGKTETAQNYSGADVPYLQSVDSAGEEALTPVYKEENKIPLAKWNEALGMNWDATMFESLQLIRNSSGRVQKMVTDGFEKEGREIRELLGLRSTDFDIAFDVTNNLVLIDTVGYGHGVGMSQYGAEALAQQGLTANEIIAHYYLDTEIKKILINDPECLKTP